MDIKRTSVKIRMGELGLTQKALAERCGLKPQNLSAILRRGTATPANVVRLAKALGVDPAEIVAEKGE